MHTRPILFIDSETGGLDPTSASILSLGAVVWNGSSGSATEFEVFIQEPIINIEATAYDIHGISRSWLEKNGVVPGEAVSRFEEFVLANFPECPKVRVTLAGHNIGFDVAFLKRLYSLASKEDSFEELFQHRVVDTSSILSFLIDSGRLPLASPSSDLAFEYFGIRFGVGERHSALGDAAATSTLYDRMLAIVRQEG